MNKRKAEQFHASMRFIERARFDFSKRTNELFCNKIITRNGVDFVRRSSNRVTLWDVHHEGKNYRCVYDKQRKQIVTVLWVHNEEIVATKILEPHKNQSLKKDVSPKKDPIFKYGVEWKNEKRLEYHEKLINQRYEKEYEKWMEKETQVIK
jgi:hypothetical protein